jgi:homoserine kinase
MPSTNTTTTHNTTHQARHKLPEKKATKDAVKNIDKARRIPIRSNRREAAREENTSPLTQD